ncbi:hypothetical protein WNB94_11765 [Aquabacterium sp. A3]|uniref:hypothetical protein n=1 Tax=Aquabacterium sp. A3 TaxID=3132829 RepID=UPI003119F1CC
MPDHSSTATWWATQLTRWMTPQAPSPAPLTSEGTLELVRQRNALLDALFYDVKVISPEEARTLAPTLAAEGALLHVPPSGQGPVVLCASRDVLCAHLDSASLRDGVPVVVAGVGSSALGSAALARNVADALGRPTVAVVSGYGLSDLLTEALGGFFLFGALNALRHQFEGLDRWRETGLIAEPDGDGPSRSLAQTSRDTQAVLGLLQDDRVPIGMLIGHSKGNLVLSEALFALRQRAPERLSELGRRQRIVTLSARIAMPRECTQVTDVMGQLDGFGALNSRARIPADHIVSGAWHHTNTDLPCHLPVRDTLRTLMAQGWQGNQQRTAT